MSSTATPQSTAAEIRSMVERHHVSYGAATNDERAHHVIRFESDFDDIKKMLIALQRAGHPTRQQVVWYQAKYLHET